MVLPTRCVVACLWSLSRRRILLGRRFYSQRVTGLKLLFLGSDEFSLEHLRTLHEAKIHGLTQVLQKIDANVNSSNRQMSKDAVDQNVQPEATYDLISDIDVISLGTKSPVRTFANQQKLRTLEWEELLERNRTPKTEGTVRDTTPRYAYDLGVVASFGKLIPENVIGLARYGMINVHPSLLPRWRGSSPIVYTIAFGDRETGVTIMRIAPHRFDVGDVLLCERILVPPNVFTIDLRDQLARLGSRLLVRTLVSLDFYLGAATPQRLTTRTIAAGELPRAAPGRLARKVKPTMFLIDWHCVTAEQLDRLYRALSTIDDLRTSYHGIPLRLIKLLPAEDALRIAEKERPSLLAQAAHWQAGTVRFSRQFGVLLILCGADRTWAACERVVYKKPQSATDFANGFVYKTPDRRLVLESLTGNPLLDEKHANSPKSALTASSKLTASSENHVHSTVLDNK